MLSTRANWSEEAYEQSIEGWLGAPGHAEELYRTSVFPLACERMRRLRSKVEPLELLFVPVGTQPYAPILAALANPSRLVALLESDESHSYGMQVEQALSSETLFLHTRVSPTDFADISEKMRAVYETQGLPRSVGADLTGGTKPMTATVAGVGSLFGWRLFYLAGQYVRERSGFAHHERVLELPSLLDLFGSRRRLSALTLLKGRAFRAAVEELKELIQESVASQADRLLLRLAQAAAALREGRVRTVARLAPGLARGVGDPLPERTLRLLRSAAEGCASSQRALLACGARILRREGDLLGARGLEELAQPETGILPALAPLDRLLGRGLTGVVEKLG